MATAGRMVTVHGVCGTTRYEACRTGRVGVIYFAHTHACKRDREEKKRHVGASCFPHTQTCGLFLLGTTQNVWADFLTPTRVAVIGVL